MKTTFLTTSIAGLGLALLPLHAADKVADHKTPAEQSATQAATIPTYLVVFSGTG